MIIVRAPLRMSFVGGGTDLRDFYHMSPGRVISTAIDQYVYVAVNRTPLMKRISVRYSLGEVVDHPRELKNDRVREALLDLGIEHSIEIGTFSHLPGHTGLGSSSAFSVALMKGLHAALGKNIDKHGIAEAACRLEIDLVGDPIGKQDQYAAALGGFNVLEFRPDESVVVDPVMLDYQRRREFENHLLLFFSGIHRKAASVLTEQKANTVRNRETLQAMADSVFEFKDRLMEGDFEGLGLMLQSAWERKKLLSSHVSNSAINGLYEAGISAGAWGGKILGAGGGGCLLLLAPPERQKTIRDTLKKRAAELALHDFQELPVRFAHSGVEVMVNSDHSRMMA
ncbi:MAG: hypothetical protein A3J58_00040 [Candidatus Sungbacteria bacterium RIFCSPHIGHO2_02_FULL_52_23]|uniref:GHMP kinase n=1 Tax=Candidatus Sungbacteria bacterium RIFCSPHIGHO2_02_FULL_52_23 TaxID=1802274 RepID=A0A1G2KWY4_9BACT|nr:MAG: hypothetical protein A3J58_00040 [Candidatus Sungbacteria bacterium RIFCSPHIGHO2_02_FULL_52_23]